MSLLAKMKHARRQKRYTKEHRQMERAGGFRLATLDDYPMVTLNGRRPWCDARLQECPHPKHTLCCYCTHTDKNPWSEDNA